MEFIENLTPLHWIAFGCALLVFELLGTAGYLLWIGLSGIGVGLIKVIAPISWEYQWIAFSVLSVLTTFIWWYKQSRIDKELDKKCTLNKLDKQIIGTFIVLTEDLSVGTNRIKIDSTSWPTRITKPIPKGTKIKVIAMDGIFLKIKVF